jgi:hypothetical protein
MANPYNHEAEKPWEPLDKIMLAEAVFCADCTAITKAKNGHCLACGGPSLLNVAVLLNREDKRLKRIEKLAGDLGTLIVGYTHASHTDDRFDMLTRAMTHTVVSMARELLNELKA